MAVKERVAELRQLIRHIETPKLQQDAGSIIGSSQKQDIQSRLLSATLRAGQIVEVFYNRSTAGAWRFAVNLIKKSQEQARVSAFIDQRLDLYPPTLQKLGIDLQRLLCLIPATYTNTLWAIEEVCKSTAVSLVIAVLDRVNQKVIRRLQLAVEESATTLILLRPNTEIRRPSVGASLRLKVDVTRKNRDNLFCCDRQLTIEVLRGPSRSYEGKYLWDLHHASGTLHTSATVPH